MVALRYLPALLSAGAGGIALLLAGPAAAGDLVFPVDCTPGQDCFIQYYVDRDTGPGAADFACGGRSHNGHDGTDIRLSDLAAMKAGVDVVAAAPGRVRSVRNGMPDIAASSPSAPNVSERACGNGVLVRDSSGREFQYCHMALNSIQVAEGDTVDAGQVLGRVGLSGETQFPHLHFTMRNTDGQVVDPFDGRLASDPCTLASQPGADEPGFWANPIAYQPGGVLAGGFLDQLPDYSAIRAGKAALPSLPTDAPALVFWAHFYGLNAGDRLELRILAPDGQPIAESVYPMPRDRAVEFRAIGRRATGPWAPGQYTGIARLVRNGIALREFQMAIEVR